LEKIGAVPQDVYINGKHQAALCEFDFNHSGQITALQYMQHGKNHDPAQGVGAYQLFENGALVRQESYISGEYKGVMDLTLREIPSVPFFSLGGAAANDEIYGEGYEAGGMQHAAQSFPQLQQG